MNAKLWRGLVAGAAFLLASQAWAQGFNNGIPGGWECKGACGTSPANGVVTSPSGNSYGWVSTNGGVNDVALPGVGGSGEPTNGSTLRSVAFAAGAGDELAFRFNYVTSDGAGFSDYAWARLLDQSGNQVALLFTARTTEDGTVIPGFSMPQPAATLVPPSAVIVADATEWAPLGDSSGKCWDVGCGNSGWIESSYLIPQDGTFYLEFGVTNWDDEAYDSGMAFDGVTIAGVPVIPEPETYLMLVAGLALLAWRRQRDMTASR